MQAVHFGLTRYDLLEHIGEVGLWIEFVQFRRVDDGSQDRPRLCSTCRSREERIPAAQCNWANRSFHYVAVYLDAAICEEHRQSVPMVEGVLDRLCQVRLC